MVICAHLLSSRSWILKHIFYKSGYKKLSLFLLARFSKWQTVLQLT
uniref:Uncharacterized protein n=1 Tax=Anguilla anguilla TaxID=7936 RepID=A0A0E9RUE1_ANGAN